MMIEQIKLEVTKCKGKREKILRYLASLTIRIVILIMVFVSTQLKGANRTLKLKMPLWEQRNMFGAFVCVFDEYWLKKIMDGTLNGFLVQRAKVNNSHAVFLFFTFMLNIIINVFLVVLSNYTHGIHISLM